MTPKQTDISESFASHREKLLGFCWRLIGNQQAAEDVTQDVFLKACSLPEKDFNTAWLYRCARNRCIDHLRRRSRWNRLKSFLSFQTQETGVDEILVNKRASLRVLGALPEKMRTALLLRSYSGLDYQTLAEILEIKESSVKVLLSRARKKACELMEEEQKL